MANRIKEIFTDKMYQLTGRIRFKDANAYNSFHNAIEVSQHEQRFVPVDGIASISTAINLPGSQFPLEEHENISKLTVGPVAELITVPLTLDPEKNTISLFRSKSNNKTTLYTTPDSVVSLQFIFDFTKKTLSLSYKPQFENATDLEALINNLYLLSLLLKQFFNDESEPVNSDTISITDIKNLFDSTVLFLKRLHQIECELKLSFSPSLIATLTDEDKAEIDELYLLLCKKLILRLNAKLTSTEATSATFRPDTQFPTVGSKIILTYVSTIEYQFLNNTINLYTANLLANAIVKAIKHNDDGSAIVLYGDTDSDPMYISFSAFTEESDAQQESNSIKEHIKAYTDAKTSSEYADMLYNTNKDAAEK